MRAVRPIVIVACLTFPAALIAQEPPDRRGAVSEQAFVERVVVDAHVTGPDGNPIPNLTPADFRVRVDGRPVTLESVDWLPAGAAEIESVPPAETASSERGDNRQAEAPPGRLIVMFFQTNYEPSRLIGLIRMAIQARRFLDTMLPTDRVAVASYDSHLKLRQDFTDDRDKIVRAIDASLRTGREPEPDPGSRPALARHLDRSAARKASTPERALALLAEALAPIPGGKSMLYFGWGLGTVGGLGGPNLSEVKAWRAALKGMAAARVNVFSLDVTDADYHSLEVYLEQLSDLTGGRYEKTNVFPNLAMERVQRAISGRYVLVFVKPRAARGTHEIRVELVGRKGRVSARQYYQD
jgi:VWFA-related protein